MIKKILCRLVGTNLDDTDVEQDIKEYTEKINQMKASTKYNNANNNIKNLAKLEKEIQRLCKEKEKLSRK